MAYKGSIELYGQEYILYMNKVKNKQEWYLIRTTHILEKDPHAHLFGRNKYPIINELTFQNRKVVNDLTPYIQEYVSATYSSPVRYSQGYAMITEVLENLRQAKSYGYSKNQIHENQYMDKFKTITYKAPGVEYHEQIKIEDGSLFGFSFEYNGMSVRMSQCRGYRFPKMDLETIPFMNRSGEFNTYSLLNIQDVNFEQILDRYGDDLGELVDLEKGTIAKNYFPVTNERDFEVNVINKILEKILHSLEHPPKDGTKHLTSLDIETTGLKFNYIPEEYKDVLTNDHAVSMQCSWEFDTSACIYTDMEYFSNLSNDYVMRRFSELFPFPDKDYIYFKQYYGNDGNLLSEPIVHKLPRKEYWLANHNIMFDSKVLRSHGHEVYFDIDTLQMAFTLNPIEFKAKKGLKELVYKLLGIFYPTLSDILGKGNEDKFKYIKDERVALLYGCCDVDLQRRVFYELKKIMDDVSPRLFKAYMAIDSYTNNILAEEEYLGVRVDNELLASRAKAVKEDLNTLQEEIYRFVGKKLYLKACNILKQPVDVLEMDAQRYEFKLGGADVVDIVYNQLNYPVLVYTKTGKPALNSMAIKKLLKQKTKEPTNELKRDILSALHGYNPKEPLIKKDEFNSYKYPLVYLLSEWKTLSKEYDAYYKPFTDKNKMTGDRIFRPIKAANIETRRTSSALQVVKSTIKEAMIAHGKDWNMFDFDMAQIEARVMSSLAQDKVMIAKLTDPEKDYHTENAGIINGIPSHLVPKELRKAAKSVGFGLPYGLSEFGLCERNFGEVNEINLIKTRMLIKAFTDVNHVFMDDLIKSRNQARIDAVIPDSLRKFLDLSEDDTVAMIWNATGFYRYQITTNLKDTEYRMKSVERAFGNYPIQSYAADLFKVIYCRLHRRIRKDGMQEYIKFHLPVHDEKLCSAHKSVNPDYILKIVKEECIVKLKGHAPYFLGLNFGDNWYQCKDDKAELPVVFVQRRAREIGDGVEKFKWCDSPAKYFAPKVLEFKKDRIRECVEAYRPDFMKEGILGLDSLLEDFANYSVRSYTFSMPLSFIPTIKKMKDGKPVYDSDSQTLSGIVSCVGEKYPHIKFILEGTMYSYSDICSLDLNTQVDISDDDDLDLDLDLEDDEDSYGEEDFTEDTFFSFDDSETFYDSYIYAENAVTVDEIEDLFVQKTTFSSDKYTYVRKLGKRISIEVPNVLLIEKVITNIEKYKDKEGFPIIVKSGRQFKATPFTYNIDLKKLDDIVTNLVNTPSRFVKSSTTFDRR